MTWYDITLTKMGQWPTFRSKTELWPTFSKIYANVMGCQDIKEFLVSDLRLISYDLIKVLIRVKLHISLNIARRAKSTSISTSDPCNDMIWRDIDKNGSLTYFWVIFAKYRAMHDLSSVCLFVCLSVSRIAQKIIHRFRMKLCGNIEYQYWQQLIRFSDVKVKGQGHQKIAKS